MIGLFTVGCGQPKTESPAPNVVWTARVATSKEVLTELAGKSWKLDHWTNADGVEREVGPITLAIGENFHLSGNASVNRYMGNAKFTDSGDLDLSAGLATTMMMGLPEAMEREKNYLADLEKVNKAGLADGRLVLTDGQKLRLEYIPAP
jgi:heat shock protein HslJ